MCAFMRSLVHVSTGPTDRSLSFRFAASAFSRSSIPVSGVALLVSGFVGDQCAVLLPAASYMHILGMIPCLPPFYQAG